MQSDVYEKIYLAGKRNKQNCIYNLIFTAVSIIYFCLMLLTVYTTNTDNRPFYFLVYALSLIFPIQLFFVFLINGGISAIEASKMLKINTTEKINVRLYTLCTAIRIILSLLLILSIVSIAVVGISYLDHIGILIENLLFFVIFATITVYQVFLIIQEIKLITEISKIQKEKGS